METRPGGRKKGCELRKLAAGHWSMGNDKVSQGRNITRRTWTLYEFRMVIETQRVDDNEHQGQERKYYR